MKRLLIVFSIMTMLLSACGGQQQKSEAISAPDFDLPNALGGNISLDNYNGRNVLLFFHMAVG